MNSKLVEILDHTRETLPLLNRRLSEIRDAAERAEGCPSWTASFGGVHVAIVAEVKRRSPSAGVIREVFDPAWLGHEYASGGAAAVSVLTNERYFGGSLEDLRMVRGAVSVPVLRKDFILDPVQIYEARAAGASAVLLIVRVLDPPRIREMSDLVKELGMGALVEVHDPRELDVVMQLDDVTVGVNSRDLDTFELKVERLEEVLQEIPADLVAVAESGLRCRADVERVAEWGADAVLIGTALAGSPDPVGAVRGLLEVERHGRS